MKFLTGKESEFDLIWFKTAGQWRQHNDSKSGTTWKASQKQENSLGFTEVNIKDANHRLQVKAKCIQPEGRGPLKDH